MYQYIGALELLSDDSIEKQFIRVTEQSTEHSFDSLVQIFIYPFRLKQIFPFIFYPTNRCVNMTNIRSRRSDSYDGFILYDYV